MELESTEFSNSKKPKWLRALEAQSWQAELLISGLAILGSFEATDLLSLLIDYTLVSFNGDLLFFLQDVFTYLGIAIYSLIFCFVVHFVLRVLWIGMLGLNSVFPNGISIQNDSSYSEEFLKELKEDLSSSDDLSMKLERMSSTLFSIASLLTMIMLVSALWIALIITVANFASKVQNVISFSQIYYGFIFFLGFFAFLFFIARNKRIAKLKWVKTNHYKFFKIFNKAFLVGLYDPITLINFIFITNIKRSKLGIYFLILIIIIAIGAGFHLRNSNVYYFSQKSFVALNTNASTIRSENYKDGLNNAQRIIRPLIQNRVITEDYLELFIPIFKRENEFVFEDCDIHLTTRNTTPDSEQKNQKRLACYQDYYHISVDSVAFSNIAPSFYYHSNRGEKGLLYMLPINNFSAGKHLLNIKKYYPTEEEDFVIQHIPFWLPEKR